MGRDAETADGGSARPAPALSDGTRGALPGTSGRRATGEQVWRGSGGGGGGGPGGDSRSEVHHKYKTLKLQQGKKRLMLK